MRHFSAVLLFSMLCSLQAAPTLDLGEGSDAVGLLVERAVTCRTNWTPCRQKTGLTFKTLCCNPTSVCIRNQGCHKCPLVTHGPLGAINGLGFGEDSTQKVVEDVTTPLACCSLCANNKLCAGFAWECGNFCNLDLSPTCTPLTYLDKPPLDGKAIFTVGGSPCSQWKATYGGPSPSESL